MHAQSTSRVARASRVVARHFGVKVKPLMNNHLHQATGQGGVGVLAAAGAVYFLCCRSVDFLYVVLFRISQNARDAGLWVLSMAAPGWSSIHTQHWRYVRAGFC